MTPNASARVIATSLTGTLTELAECFEQTTDPQKRKTAVDLAITRVNHYGLHISNWDAVYHAYGVKRPNATP